jgi:hypothetical protein
MCPPIRYNEGMEHEIAQPEVYEVCWNVAYEGTFRTRLFRYKDEAIAEAHRWMADDTYHDGRWAQLSELLWAVNDVSISVVTRKLY